jgi:hypothetical protein
MVNKLGSQYGKDIIIQRICPQCGLIYQGNKKWHSQTCYRKYSAYQKALKGLANGKSN